MQTDAYLILTASAELDGHYFISKTSIKQIGKLSENSGPDKKNQSTFQIPVSHSVTHSHFYPIPSLGIRKLIFIRMKLALPIMQ
jgi:hypothetical protein